MPVVSPAVIKWARDTAGLSVEKAAKSLNFKDSQILSAVQQLEAMERGDLAPTRADLIRMSEVYRRSLLILCLDRIPKERSRGSDFRTVQGGQAADLEPLLDALLRETLQKQVIAREILEEEGADRPSIVGTLSLDTTISDAAAMLLKSCDFDYRRYRKQANAREAFNYARSTVEAAGVFVLLAGDLGNYLSEISPLTFRGYAAADDVAPFILINDRDAPVAWAFTMFHELAHIWLGASGISGQSNAIEIERFCDKVASEVLLPESELTSLKGLEGLSLADQLQQLSLLSNAWHLSRKMIAYRLYKGGKVTESRWKEIDSELVQIWVRRTEKDEPVKEGKQDGNWYNTKRHRIGPALVEMGRRAVAEEIITRSEAALLLGVKAVNLDRLINLPRRREAS